MMRKQVEALEDDADVPPQLAQFGAAGRQRLAIEHDRTFIDGLQTVNTAEQRGLARPRTTDDRYDLTGLDVERHVVEDKVRAVALMNAA